MVVSTTCAVGVLSLGQPIGRKQAGAPGQIDGAMQPSMVQTVHKIVPDKKVSHIGAPNAQQSQNTETGYTESRVIPKVICRRGQSTDGQYKIEGELVGQGIARM